jgi:peroxiredoxin
VAQLRRTKHRFDQAGARVVLVAMGTPAESSAFAREFSVPFEMVCDPGRRVYQAFDLEQMAPWGFLSPTVALKGVMAMAKGHGIGAPKGDIRQLPGVFIIDSKGTIVFSHFAADPADHPAPDEILAALAAI